MTNATYTDYPFTSNGINFFSRVYSHSEMAGVISSLPAEIFTSMNQNAIEELIGDPSLLSTPELLQELTHLNEGGTGVFLMLGDN